jgi:hypothetical protein
MPCAEGLGLVQDLYLQRIRLATDCVEVVLSVNNSSNGRHGMIVKEIKAREETVEDIQLSYENRIEGIMMRLVC